MPLALTDSQLRLIMSAATSIKYERRGDFLQALVRELGREPDIGRAITQAKRTKSPELEHA